MELGQTLMYPWSVADAIRAGLNRPVIKSPALNHEIRFAGNVTGNLLNRMSIEDEVLGKIIKEGEEVPNPDGALLPLTASSFSETDKFTAFGQRCLALVLCSSNEVGAQSLLFHIPPIGARRLNVLGKVEQFGRLRERSSGQIRALIAGGCYAMIPGNPYPYKSEYVGLLQRVVHATRFDLGVDPVILPPKGDQDFANIFVKTQEQKVLVLQSNKNEPFPQEPFYLEELPEKRKHWDYHLEAGFIRAKMRLGGTSH